MQMDQVGKENTVHGTQYHNNNDVEIVNGSEPLSLESYTELPHINVQEPYTQLHRNIAEDDQNYNDVSFTYDEYKQMNENRIETNSHRSRSSYSGEDSLLSIENSHIQTDESVEVDNQIYDDANHKVGEYIKTDEYRGEKISNVSEWKPQDEHYLQPIENLYVQLDESILTEGFKKQRLKEEKDVIENIEIAKKEKLINRKVHCWAFLIAILLLTLELAVIIYLLTESGEMEAAVDSSIKKWSKWTPWSGTCEVGTRIRSRICGNGHQCPIQLENTKHCSASNISIYFSESRIINQTCSNCTGSVFMERICVNKNNCTGQNNITIAFNETEIIKRQCSVTENQQKGGCIPENWIFVNRDDTQCIGDCQNGTVTERYKCEAISCQGISDYFSPASNGTVEIVKRKGMCNQQTVCQKCSESESCQLEFKFDYNGCDLKKLAEFVVPSWQLCALICSSRQQCNFWTWAHQNSSVKPFTCFLKESKCNVKASNNFISGGKKCIELSTTSTCPPKYGISYGGCNLKKIPHVTSWEKCNKLCFATQDCKYWTWYHRGHKSSPQTCWLKNNLCEEIPSSYAISGDVSKYYLPS